MNCKILTFFVFNFLFLIYSCEKEHNPTAPELRYPLAEEQGIDASGLMDATTILSENRHIRCLLVERNGVIVMEEYFNGNAADSFYDVRSVTKSITSILIGIAIDKGFIKNVDETIADYLKDEVPDLDSATARITIRNLLTMTSGLPWRELGVRNSDFSEWVHSVDPLLWILEKPLEHTPGEYWNYNTGACHILSAILVQATGVTPAEFALRYVLGPMNEQVGYWPADDRGYNYGGHGISLTGRAMIKIGRLFLDQGACGDMQIVSSSWVNESTAFHYSAHEIVPWGSSYGYLWWRGTEGVTDLSFYFAMGYGGQFIINIPSKNTVIAAATAWSGVGNADTNWHLVLSTLIERIFPALH